MASKSGLKRALGVIKQQEQKQNSPYESIINLLKPNRSIAVQENFQQTVLQQLDNFHKYYNQRYQESKTNYEKIYQQNWQYATKIVKYEQALENYQLMHQEAKQNIQFLQSKLAEVQNQVDQNRTAFALIINSKDRQINDLKAQLYRNSLKIEAPKKKIVKLKDKSIRFEQEEMTNIESARSNRCLNSLKNQMQQYIIQIEELTRDNELLKKKVKHLEADRKYEDERLKNATLSLQLDLKIKNEQIQRLNNQLGVYQKKFQQMIQTLKASNVTLTEKYKSRVVEQKQDTLETKFYDNWQNAQIYEIISMDEKEGERTHRKLDIETTQKKSKTHKRYGSSNLQQYSRKENQKQDLNMKIKIFKYSKNKKNV